jgi:2-octaprenyl-6-methoxyphenol hydroxylase
MRLRLVDGTRRLVRAPELTFEAEDVGLEAFGHNIENEILRGVLRKAAAAQPDLRILDVPVDEVSLADNGARLRAGGREERLRLVVAADGRNSICRRAANISTDRREFPQTALALNLRHSRPHRETSTEFHTESGPFTLVPLPGNRSSLVWVVRSEQAGALLKLDDASLSIEIERGAHSILGEMQVDGPRASFPLSVEIAQRFAGRRVALVGEAGHLLPPIGAQGLNLGIRDAATIAELVVDARRAGADVGAPAVLDAYDARRRTDVRMRALAVELMNRPLLTDFLPVHAMRGLGLELAGRFGFVRRAMMRGGLGPREDEAPRLARGESL